MGVGVFAEDRERYLYTWWDADGRRLYIGMTALLAERYHAHKYKPMFRNVARITVRPLGVVSHSEALRIERVEIWRHKPEGNKLIVRPKGLVG